MPSGNSNYWNRDYDWKRAGEEWSDDWGDSGHQWLMSIYPRISGFLPAHTILELAPGYGRWSAYLSEYCNKLFLVDVSATCIEACQKRFARQSSINCYCNDGKSLPMLESASVDFVFSFDSLVHADIQTMSAYLYEICRVLKKGGAAFLHHSNLAACNREPDRPSLNIHNRDDSVSAEAIRDILRRSTAELNLISQELIPWGYGNRYLTDCFTIIQKPSKPSLEEPKIVRNFDFMAEASKARQSFIDSISPFYDGTDNISGKAEDEKV